MKFRVQQKKRRIPDSSQIYHKVAFWIDIPWSQFDTHSLRKLFEKVKSNHISNYKKIWASKVRYRTSMFSEIFHIAGLWMSYRWLQSQEHSSRRTTLKKEAKKSSIYHWNTSIGIKTSKWKFSSSGTFYIKQSFQLAPVNKIPRAIVNEKKIRKDFTVKNEQLLDAWKL